MKNTKEYAMFSKKGNAKVHEIVQSAIKNNTPWCVVQQQLHTLSRGNFDKYGEATDTAVREAVYVTLYDQ